MILLIHTFKKAKSIAGKVTNSIAEPLFGWSAVTKRIPISTIANVYYNFLKKSPTLVA